MVQRAFGKGQSNKRQWLRFRQVDYTIFWVCLVFLSVPSTINDSLGFYAVSVFYNLVFQQVKAMTILPSAVQLNPLPSDFRGKPAGLKPLANSIIQQMQAKHPPVKSTQPAATNKKRHSVDVLSEKPPLNWVPLALLGGTAIATVGAVIAVYHNKAQGQWKKILPTLQEDLGKVFGQVKQKNEPPAKHSEAPPTPVLSVPETQTSVILVPPTPPSPTLPVVPANNLNPAVPTAPVMPNRPTPPHTLPPNPITNMPSSVIPPSNPAVPVNPAPVRVTLQPQPQPSAVVPMPIVTPQNQPFQSKSLLYFVKSSLALNIIKDIRKAEDLTPERIEQLIPKEEILAFTKPYIESPTGFFGFRKKPSVFNLNSFYFNTCVGGKFRFYYLSDLKKPILENNELKKCLIGLYVLQQLKQDENWLRQAFLDSVKKMEPIDRSQLSRTLERGFKCFNQTLIDVQKFNTGLVETCFTQIVPFNFDSIDGLPRRSMKQEEITVQDFQKIRNACFENPLALSPKADTRSAGLKLYFTDYTSKEGYSGRLFEVAENINDPKDLTASASSIVLPQLLASPDNSPYCLYTGKNDRGNLIVSYHVKSAVRSSSLKSIHLENTNNSKGFLSEQWQLIQSVLLTPELRFKIFESVNSMGLVSQVEDEQASKIEDLKNLVVSYAITKGWRETRYLNAGNLWYELKETAEKYSACTEWQNATILAKLSDLNLPLEAKQQLVHNENERLALMGRIFDQCKAQGWAIPPEVEQRYNQRFSSPDRLATLWQNDIAQSKQS